MNAKRIAWGLCMAWALFWLLGGVGGIQGGHRTAFWFVVLAALPAAALAVRPSIKATAWVYWVLVTGIGFGLLLLGGGMPVWMLLLLPGLAAVGFVWLSGNKPTGAFNGRWMMPKEAEKFRISIEEEPRTLAAGIVPQIAVEESGLVGLKPYTVSSIQKELGHMTVIAPTRSGKGLLLTAHLLSWNQSLIVLDIKGENWTRTSAYRASLGPVYVLNPEGYGARFDPVAELLDLGNDAEAALLQAANIIVRPEEEKQPIFGFKAVAALKAGMRVAHALGEPILPWVYGMSRQGVRAYVQGVQARAQELGDWESIDNITEYLDRPLADVKEEMWADARWLPVQSWSNLTTSLGRICTEGVLKMTSGRDFRAADLKQRPVSVYLIWHEDMGEGMRDMFSLVAMALTKGMGRYADQHAGQPMTEVLFVIDEAGTFKVPDLPTLMSTLAGRGVWVAPYFQGVNQMKAVYNDKNDKNADETIISNSSVRVWYPTDETSAADYVEKMAGKKSVETISTSSGSSRTYGSGGGAVEGAPLSLGGISRTSNESITRNMVDRPLITAAEFGKLGDNAVLIQFRNHHWLRAQPVRWFALPHLQDRAAERGINGEPIAWSFNEYRSKLGLHPVKTPVKQYADGTRAEFFSPDEN